MYRAAAKPTLQFARSGRAGLASFVPEQAMPESELYGKPCDRFRVSTPRMFDDGQWQLRTMEHRGRHFIVPFLIDSGVADSLRPIMVPQLLSRILGRSVEPSEFSWGSATATDDRVTLPSPAGELREFCLLGADGATVGKRLGPTEDLRYNRIGSGLAFFIRDVHAAALKVHDGRLPFDKTLEWLIADCAPEKGLRDHIQNPSNRWRVERELSACVGALKDDDVPLDELARRWALETK